MTTVPDSQAPYRQILGSATDTAVISTDLEGRILTWNEGAQRILGWDAQEMAGATLERIFTEEDRRHGQLQAEIDAALTYGRGNGEGWRLRKDGTMLWAIGEMTPLHGVDGKPVGLVKVLRDRTAEKRLEQDLREKTFALEILHRAGSALASERDVGRLIQTVTDAGVALTGAQFGVFCYNTTDAEGASTASCTFSGEVFREWEDAMALHGAAAYAPIFHGRDIVRSDDLPRDPHHGQDSLLRKLPARSYLAVSVVSRSGEVIGGMFFGHRQAGVFSERSEDGLIGLAAEAAMAIDNARLMEEVRRELEQRKRAQQALIALNQSLEEEVRHRTAQLRANEDALRQAQKMEAVGQLTGGVAHDFNNLLQVILGNLELLQRELPQELGRLQRVACNAMRGAERAAALTRRLLAFSRRQPLDPKPTDINVLVQGISELIRRALGETVQMATVLDPDLWQVGIDQNQLESALLNLAVNAKDAMRGGGRLTIETANQRIDESYAADYAGLLPGQYVLISVSDDGCGMDEQTRQRAFEPFFTTKRAGEGTGLGLSQVYGFVKQSGGYIRLDSEPGQGATVKIYLPRLRPQDAAPEQAGPVVVPTATRAEVVLVLEDDADVRAHTVSSLIELGYRVLEASDGPTALRMLERDGAAVQLLLTDVVLPGGLSGMQVADRAAALRPGLRVLFATGYARSALHDQGGLDRDRHLLIKPFTYAQLASKVRAALDG